MSRPSNIGILALELYIPTTYISQSDLEHYDKESKGKYTIGLGQTEMSCIGDREDINSISSTVLLQLLEKHNICPSQIGRIEIGTETIQDKSKSTKTYLMSYLQNSYNIEGVTSYNACYGGVQALFNTVAWMESSSWDGKFGVVIASDIAVYEKGPARPTGGVGAVGILIGPNAPLVLDSLRTSYMEHAYDFYKPIPSSEYPVVDGHFSVNCYLKAISTCFEDLKRKTGAMTLASLGDYWCFHAPYHKMTVKAFFQIASDDLSSRLPHFDPKDKQNWAIINDYLGPLWNEKCEKGTRLGKRVGNIYCGSLFMSLKSLLTFQDIEEGKSIVMFAYGSGLAASMFRIVARTRVQMDQRILTSLGRRVGLDPEEYTRRMGVREKDYERKSFVPKDPVEELAPGTVYLDRVDEKWRRFYKRVENTPKL